VPDTVARKISSSLTQLRRIILLPFGVFYSGVDILILLGVSRDLLVTRRIHPVYLCALPAFVFGQTFVLYTTAHNSPYG
jgi:hypothetical protein